MSKLRGLISTLALGILMLTQGCYNGEIISGSAMPSRLKYLNGSPDGPPLFKTGWKDGCTTAKGATGSSFYKEIYNEFVRDLNISDQDYKIGWNYGFWFCHRFYETKNWYSGML